MEAVTDDDGVYEVYGLTLGNYRIVIDNPERAENLLPDDRGR
jgi:hypothetical protein